MRSYADPPVLLTEVIEDLDAVDRLMRAQAPYTPLGGWYNPGADPTARTRPMWFQNDWVHDTFIAPGAELFLHNESYIEATKQFYDAEVVEPHSVYVNHMACLADSGPAHTDNPRFDGRDRANTPMWTLRTMHWSHLFNAQEIVQATAIWWMNDVEGGAFNYWCDGPSQPPRAHVGSMANTALLGDNHGMFHQVGPVGPYDNGTVLVSPAAELAPTDDGLWSVIDHGEVIFAAPLNGYRVSVLWKANVYATADEQEARSHQPLSMADVADVFNADLEARGADIRLTVEMLEAGNPPDGLAAWYPEDVPVGAARSIYAA